MRRQKLYSGKDLNQAIEEYYNGTKKTISVTELMNVCLKSVEAPFQMIMDACEFAVTARYQLDKNRIFAFSYLPISSKSRFQAQTG